MRSAVFTVSGRQADYLLRLIPTEEGQAPVLVGISGKAAGEIHQVSGSESIEFSDATVQLNTTALGNSTTAAPPTSLRKTQQEFAVSPAALVDEAAAPPPPSRVLSKKAIDPSNYSSPVNSVTLADNNDYINNTADFAAHSRTSPDNSPIDNPKQILEDGQLPFLNTSASLDSSPPLTPTLQLPSIAFGPGARTIQEAGGAEATITISPNLIQGSQSADRLIGTPGADIIDGLLNSDLDGAFFHEEMMGEAGDDQMFYRGFFGDIQSATTIKATLMGGDGNDTISISLDRSTLTQVDGGSGLNTLIFQASEAPFNPWHTDHFQWSWSGTTNAPTLQGLYTSPLHSQASIQELSPSFQSIASSNSSPLNLVRPEPLNATELFGTSGADFLLAGDQTQHIAAGSGNDTVIARAGNIISLGAGINTLFSYSSNVTLDYSQSPHSVNLSLANKMGLVFDETSQIYAVDRLIDEVLHVNGSRFNDVLSGDRLDNTLRSGGGQDTLWGGLGADTFVIDIENTNNASVILDFNIAQSDHLVLNLSQWISPNNQPVGRYQLLGDDGQVWGGAALTNEESALLSILISQNTQSIQIGLEGQYQTVVRFDQPIDDWSSDRWTTALTIDYL